MTGALHFKYHHGGVYLPRLGLWLDPHEPQTGGDRAFVSHAHSDHTGLHRETILSEPTGKLMRARIGGEGIEHLLPFKEPRSFAAPDGTPFQITLYPAGHIFGSAMSLIEAEGGSLLYTGDFKLRPGLSAEACEPPRADLLIMETTYGRPAYRFPPSAEVMRGVIRFCREALDHEETPVLLGYSLGKSQEILCGLADANLPLMLHGSIHKLTRIYEQFGRCFPPHEKYDKAAARGKVLLFPPNAANSATLRSLGKTRTAVLTGWAVDAHCRYRYQADAAFPLSDHADFPDLIEMARRVGPKKVFTLHGFAADFAQTLRDLGFDAQALSEEEQLALPLSFASRKETPPRRKKTAAADSEENAAAPPEAAPELPMRVAAGAAPRPPEMEWSPGASGAGDRFHRFAEVCSQVGSTPKKLEKTRLLADYFSALADESLAQASVWLTGLPFPSSAQKPLQLGWAIIRDALCAAGGLDQAQFGQVYLKHSDLGETAFEILLKGASAAATPAVADVADLFERLYAARGPSGKMPILAQGLRYCSALEGKYLVKILTGDLRIGLKEGLVEEAIAQAFSAGLDEVKNANLLLGNIGATALLARRNALGAAAMEPFRPIKFMLASPEETAEDIWKRVEQWSHGKARPAEEPMLGFADGTPVAATAWLEDKYDGIRAQLHKQGGRVAIYSRDLKEITATFIEIADAARALPVDCALDGEIVAMKDGQVLPFADLQRRLGRREADLFLGEEIPVRFIAFDLLWLDGQDRLNASLRDRRAALEALPGIYKAQITQVSSVEQIEAAFSAARERGNEGLMIKDPASAYTPGRRGLSWLKLKKAFATLDCVVVGAEFGHGKRSQVLSDYTFAVRDTASGQLRVIGKAYTGLTDAEIAQLTQHFKSKARRQRGRYFEVEPDTVLEIAFDILQPSSRHDSGLAMRFPRITRIRTDKDATQIDTLETAWALVKKARKE